MTERAWWGLASCETGSRFVPRARFSGSLARVSFGHNDRRLGRSGEGEGDETERVVNAGGSGCIGATMQRAARAR